MRKLIDELRAANEEMPECALNVAIETLIDRNSDK